MSFLNIFKTKQKKHQDIQVNRDEDEPNLPARRCSISKSGRLKARQIRKPLHSDFITNKDNDKINCITVIQTVGISNKNKCDEKEINSRNTRKLSNHDIEENLNEEDVVKDIYNVACSRLETAL